jgi:hypothetical protein
LVLALRMEVPMLDEAEYQMVVTDQMNRAFQELAHQGSQEAVQQRTPELMAEEYERLTDYRIADPWHIFHHTTIGVGPPCLHCGKPLRTRRVKLCDACAAAVEN